MPATNTRSNSKSHTRTLDSLFPEQVIRWADDSFGDGLVMSTSFGIQSAVMLHMATQIRPTMPVIWVDTGYLHPQTYYYAEMLAERLNLNLQIARATLKPLAMEDEYGRLWESDRIEDLNLYDRIRKVEPMQKILASLGATAWISGLRAGQTDYRKRLSRVERKGNQVRVYPILPWTSRDVYHYMQEHNLPQHPLFDEGYTTIGDMHSSRPRQAGEDDRATRFHGMKQECGLHLS